MSQHNYQRLSAGYFIELRVFVFRAISALNVKALTFCLTFRVKFLSYFFEFLKSILLNYKGNKSVSKCLSLSKTRVS